jgi:hypothetical protein
MADTSSTVWRGRLGSTRTPVSVCHSCFSRTFQFRFGRAAASGINSSWRSQLATPYSMSHMYSAVRAPRPSMLWRASTLPRHVPPRRSTRASLGSWPSAGRRSLGTNCGGCPGRACPEQNQSPAAFLLSPGCCRACVGDRSGQRAAGLSSCTGDLALTKPAVVAVLPRLERLAAVHRLEVAGEADFARLQRAVVQRRVQTALQRGEGGGRLAKRLSRARRR